ncbi:KpsF/GutQ family sugar-phosphate isomerase [Desertivirga arenae]|uniref:KpsF/GutQ family sugar-phosphate isomerase n=1 Tax=Desertivirga arenae TaxID=2810309 RepID=UPI001F62319E|nr:KpsF/GutQ family sugar-phosphate isomerase [Pedobacter sp. SYSU D00823]
MKTITDIIQIAQRTLQIESEGISGLMSKLNNDFALIVEKILGLKGRVIITGVGKSGIIAQKIVATFNSTGTPAIFMHAADAIHGDLGIIQDDDLVICISKSGNTPEIKVLVPLLKLAGNPLVAMVGDRSSYLAKQANYIIDTTVEKEACPHNLAPTTSTTAQLVMGDILAVCLLECREFTTADFAKYHPGGSLGKRLYLKVADIYIHNEKPEVDPDASIKKVILEITKNRLGAVAVVDQGRIAGIITDGDIRRMMEKFDLYDGLTAKDIMGTSPKQIASEELAATAFDVMRANNITQLIVTEGNIYKGIIHLHDLLKEGFL